LLEEEHPSQIRWDFRCSHRRRFTDPRYALLMESAKQVLALIRTHSLHSGLAQRARTVAKYFYHLRTLIRWMDEEGFCRFSDLDAAALLRFQGAIARRKKNSGGTVAPITVHQHLCLLVYLYQFRDELDDGLSVDPCPGQSLLELAGVRRANMLRWPYTPDNIAVPLIQGALDLLDNCAIDILRAREVYATAMAAAGRRGVCYSTRTYNAERALRRITTLTPKGPRTIQSAAELAELVDLLYAACFVVISYLIGPRASELLQLKASCLQARLIQSQSGETELTMIVGSIFRGEPGYHGRVHEWVAPQAAAHAVSVLEALSAPHRLKSGRSQLWLRALGRGRSFGAKEWQMEFKGPWHIPTSPGIADGLNRFATWLALPPHKGKSWHLSTHQGRKTFVRFTALRDRSALFALAQHLGHRDRSVTDTGYVGTDYALDREIQAEILEQSVSAWEHMLSAPQLGGRAGAEILAKRPQFRGVRIKKDLKSYARMLVEAGLTLGVCDWGYCVFRVEYSACRGNAAGPNPVYREPSTCARCKNFVVSSHHRSYWLDQARRHEALLNEPALPTQTLKIARERLEETRSMLRSIDSSTKERGS
jgi:integrase